MQPQSIQSKLEAIIDPVLGGNLGRLRMVRDIRMDSDQDLIVQIALPYPGYHQRSELMQAIQEAVNHHMPGRGCRVEYALSVLGKETGGAIGLRIKNVVAVGSGKGGVGKSTVAACLAFGLQHLGARVGLMDADVYGPSIPQLVGGGGVPAMVSQTLPSGQVLERMSPVDVAGVRVISMGYFLKPDQAVIWRGPLLHRAITQFLKDTDWGELDYLIIDLPPGTGDVSLTLSQLLGLAGAVVVCTPQQVALLDAIKAISMFRQVKIPVLGMIENMSGDVFGRGGARRKAEELGLPILGEVPLDPQLRILGDEGRIAELYRQDSPLKALWLEICSRTAQQIAREILEHQPLPTLEIL